MIITGSSASARQIYVQNLDYRGMLLHQSSQVDEDNDSLEFNSLFLGMMNVGGLQRVSILRCFDTCLYCIREPFHGIHQRSQLLTVVMLALLQVFL